ncbi:MAG: ferredoxin--NADP reductase [Planctomycetes bacterium]|nr:ferredoxin--NADP reductase [Planctomycetota bacterium]
MAQDTLNAIVTQRLEESPGLMILRVAPDGWRLPAFRAGQFAVLGLPSSAPRCSYCDPEEAASPGSLIKRAYSIASSSVSDAYLELYISLVHSGALTPRLFALRRGDSLWLSPRVSGLFTLAEVPRDQHVVLIATGTGLAPYMSMLRSELTCGGPRRFAVLHGARHSWDLGYRSELMALQRMCPNFAYLPTISRPEEEPAPWNGLKGRVQEQWMAWRIEESAGLRFTPANSHVFLCGNPGMVDDMQELLEREGYGEHTRGRPGQLHVERYW